MLAEVYRGTNNMHRMQKTYVGNMTKDLIPPTNIGVLGSFSCKHPETSIFY